MTDDDLSLRVAALEDRLELIELEAAYARAFDSRDGAAWAALYGWRARHRSIVAWNRLNAPGILTPPGVSRRPGRPPRTTPP